MTTHIAPVDRLALAHKSTRENSEHLRFSGEDLLVRATAESTGGAFTVFEEINPIDVPLHVHSELDELFYVLEGDHVFTVGDRQFAAGPGDLVFGPRGIPHAQKRVIPRTGRILALVNQVGFEGFFRELADVDGSGEASQHFVEEITERYGARWV